MKTKGEEENVLFFFIFVSFFFFFVVHQRVLTLLCESYRSLISRLTAFSATDLLFLILWYKTLKAS